MSIAIKAENLSKKYTLRHAVEDIHGNGTKELWALKNVSFEIKRGERVGIIGSNGCGKSTLLKILSGITKPTTGSAIIYGRVASILDIGAGFHPELSGRENIFLNGEILGFGEKEISVHFDDIVEFSGIKKFIDEPVKNYSNGMYLRLAFSIMVHLDFDIYLLDEVMNVGDASFRAQSTTKINEIASGENKTIVMVSHNIWEMQDVDRMFYLSQGEADTTSKVEDVIRKYYSNSQEYKLKFNNPFNIDKNKLRESDDYIDSLKLYLLNKNQEKVQSFKNNEPITIVIDLCGIRQMFNVGICLRDKYGTAVLEISHVLSGLELLKNETNQRISFTFPERYFNANEFLFDVILFNKNKVVCYMENMCSLSVVIEDIFVDTMYENTWGVVKPFLEWKIEKKID